MTPTPYEGKRHERLNSTGVAAAVPPYLVDVKAHTAVEERQQPENVQLLGDAVHLQGMGRE